MIDFRYPNFLYQLTIACGSDNKSILRHVLHHMPPNVKSQLKQVYFTAFSAINEAVPIQILYEKCGGKCANFLISALAIVLTHCWQGVSHCRQNDTNNPQCEPNVYLYANQSIENMEPVAVTCFETVGIPITPAQSRHIAISLTKAIVNAVKTGKMLPDLPGIAEATTTPDSNKSTPQDIFEAVKDIADEKREVLKQSEDKLLLNGTIEAAKTQ